jgi:sugar phosphate isomerase/epimerase
MYPQPVPRGDPPAVTLHKQPVLLYFTRLQKFNGFKTPAEFGVDQVFRKLPGIALLIHIEEPQNPVRIPRRGRIDQTRRAAPGATGGFEFRAVGYGIQDIPSILKAAGEAGASWVVVEQDLPTPGKTPLECARDSIEYLQGLS